MIESHTDVVGSLLRPAELLKAQQDLATGRISRPEFKVIEDRAVDAAVALQESTGLEVLTDGEMRRLSFQSQMTQAVDGFGEWDINAFLWGDWYGDDALGEWHKRRPPNLGVVEKLTRKRHLCVEEFVYLRARTERIPKITLPSPSLFANFWSPERSSEAYPTLESFLTDVVDILRDEVVELIRLGATYIQVDAPHYPLLLDPNTRAFYESRGWDLNQWLGFGIELDNALMTDFSEVTFGFHLCRGNQGSRWLVEGGYDLIAKPIFQNIRAQRLLLEYDDPRSGSFEPLREVPDDRIVVLGLVTTKRPQLESAQDLKRRVEEASLYIALERLAVSPQCGFSTSIVGNNLSIEDQRRKLEVMCDAARSLWG
ncbi:MAG: cobalamin-independent methionine synthase II family protein [Gammaproteobacteria bacterium]|nr:cobalamin-independent methionine synthase II family protein [Gammaproteobacteria bacterium]